MSRNKKPRKAYRPKPLSNDTMAIAKHFAAKPVREDRNEILTGLQASIKALREGVATEHQWSIVAGSLSVANAIERQGVVRGLAEHFASAEQALQNIYDRALRMGNGRWVRVTLYFYELDVLAEFFDLYKFQVNQLGRAEFLNAIDAARKQTASEGHTVTVETCLDTERMAA